MSTFTNVASTYTVHEAAEMFPLMSEYEYQSLKNDIEVNGLQQPLFLWNGQLIDGRNRMRACEELGIEPWTFEIDIKEDPWTVVVSHNLHRRHLTASQRSAVAAKIAKRQKGDNQYTEVDGQICPSTKDVAKMFNVSEMSVKHAKKVLADGAEDVQNAVDRGEIPVSVAAEFVKQVPDHSDQVHILKQGEAAVKSRVKEKPLAKKRLTKREAEEKRSQAFETFEAAADDAIEPVLQVVADIDGEDLCINDDEDPWVQQFMRGKNRTKRIKALLSVLTKVERDLVHSLLR